MTFGYLSCMFCYILIDEVHQKEPEAQTKQKTSFHLK